MWEGPTKDLPARTLLLHKDQLRELENKVSSPLETEPAPMEGRGGAWPATHTCALSPTGSHVRSETLSCPQPFWFHVPERGEKGCQLYSRGPGRGGTCPGDQGLRAELIGDPFLGQRQPPSPTRKRSHREQAARRTGRCRSARPAAVSLLWSGGRTGLLGGRVRPMDAAPRHQCSWGLSLSSLPAGSPSSGRGSPGPILRSPGACCGWAGCWPPGP